MITRSRMHRALTYAAWRAGPGIDAVSAHHVIHRLVAAGYTGKASLAVARSGEAIVERSSSANGRAYRSGDLATASNRESNWN